MQGVEVYNVLRGKYISNLFHANTVETSCSFLQEKGLASRGYIADRGLPQTSQYTDLTDKRYGIWYDVFMDTVDIHNRASGRNYYGPVLFILPLNILRNLPSGSSVLVTKKNPTKWTSGESDDNRFFLSVDDLKHNGVERGTFDHMVIIRTPTGILPFPAEPISITLDDPQKNLSNGNDAFMWAQNRLAASSRPGSNINITRRKCCSECRCLKEYSSEDINPLFL